VTCNIASVISAQKAREAFARQSAPRLEAAEILFTEECLHGDVEREQYQRNTRVPNDVRRMRVRVDIVLRPSRSMSQRAESTSHYDDLLDAGGDVRMEQQGKCNIGLRPYRADGDFMATRGGFAGLVCDKPDGGK